MPEEIDVETWLRRRVMGLLHAGRVGSGDRLPSIRQLTEITGADHRAIAAAYRALETEGLVSIRPGSGVYLAHPVQVGKVLSGTMRWLTELMLDGWERGLSRADVGELVRRSTAKRLRCACLESNEDHMVAVCAELEQAFTLEAVPIRVDPATNPSQLPESQFAEVDLIVSTIFHADLARAAALRAGKPVVVVRLHPEFSAEVDRLLARGPATAVFVDPRFEERARSYLAVTAHQNRIRFVPVDRVEEEQIDLDAENVMVTRAARRRLGMADYHLLPPPPQVIAPESAREIFDVAVELAFGGEMEAQDRR